MKDWRGTPIEEGSTVVYPGRVSSALWMNEAKVVEVQDGRLKVHRTARSRRGWGTTDKVTYLTAIDRVTVVA